MPAALGGSDFDTVAANTGCDRFSTEGWVRTSIYVPRETELTIHINQQPLVQILCTAAKLDCLTLGYLYAEGIIAAPEEAVSLQVQVNGGTALAAVQLSNPVFEPPALRTLGCSGSTVFQNQGLQVDSELVVTTGEILSLMNKFFERMELYRLSGGVHASVLADKKNLLVLAEDIGRHNTLNKVQGECLLRNIPTKNRLLLTTGRISSEMLLKAAKMQAPVVVSRHAPTMNAIELAQDLGIALVGQVRGSQLSVFAHAERLGCPAIQHG